MATVSEVARCVGVENEKIARWAKDFGEYLSLTAQPAKGQKRQFGGENEYSTLRALGTDVEACSSVYYWPKEKRKLSDTNKPGILHVKCAVADGEWLFLSSANLTQQAFTINMELGMLVRGGTIPRRVEKQFERLVQMKTLERV